MDAVEFLFSLSSFDKRFDHLGRVLQWLLKWGVWEEWRGYLMQYDAVYCELESVVDYETKERLKEIRERVANAIATAWLLAEMRGEVGEECLSF
jgi:hypothetical protein